MHYEETTTDSGVAEKDSLITPYGGKLVNLVVPAEKSAELKDHASSLPSIQISERAVCDLELLASGATSVVFDNDESRFFVATSDGSVLVYDMATHVLLDTWEIGNELGAMSLSGKQVRGSSLLLLQVRLFKCTTDLKQRTS